MSYDANIDREVLLRLEALSATVTTRVFVETVAVWLTQAKTRLEASEAARAKAEGELEISLQTATTFSLAYEDAESRLAATTGEVAMLTAALERVGEENQRLRKGLNDIIDYVSPTWMSVQVDVRNLATEALAPPAVVPPPQPVKEPSR